MRQRRADAAPDRPGRRRAAVLGNRDGQLPLPGDVPVQARLGTPQQAASIGAGCQVSQNDPLPVPHAGQCERDDGKRGHDRCRQPPPRRVMPCLVPAAQRARRYLAICWTPRPPALSGARCADRLLTRIRPTLSRTGAPSALAMSYRRRGLVETSADTITQPMPMARPAKQPADRVQHRVLDLRPRRGLSAGRVQWLPLIDLLVADLGMYARSPAPPSAAQAEPARLLALLRLPGWRAWSAAARMAAGRRPW